MHFSGLISGTYDLAQQASQLALPNVHHPGVPRNCPAGCATQFGPFKEAALVKLAKQQAGCMQPSSHIALSLGVALFHQSSATGQVVEP